MNSCRQAHVHDHMHARIHACTERTHTQHDSDFRVDLTTACQHGDTQSSDIMCYMPEIPIDWLKFNLAESDHRSVWKA